MMIGKGRVQLNLKKASVQDRCRKEKNVICGQSYEHSHYSMGKISCKLHPGITLGLIYAISLMQIRDIGEKTIQDIKAVS